MKPLTISDFSFTIKKPSSTAVAEPAKKPEVNETKPPEPAIDTSKLTDEQAEKFKGLLSVDPENAQDITVEEYIALAESVMTFKEETIEGYNRYQDDDELRSSKVQLELKVRFDDMYGEKNPEAVFSDLVQNATENARYDSYAIQGLRFAEGNQKAAIKLLDQEYLAGLQSDVLTYLKDSGEQLVDEKA